MLSSTSALRVGRRGDLDAAVHRAEAHVGAALAFHRRADRAVHRLAAHRSAARVDDDVAVYGLAFTSPPTFSTRTEAVHARATTLDDTRCTCMSPFTVLPIVRAPFGILKIEHDFDVLAIVVIAVVVDVVIVRPSAVARRVVAPERADRDVLPSRTTAKCTVVRIAATVRALLGLTCALPSELADDVHRAVDVVELDRSARWHRAVPSPRCCVLAEILLGGERRRGGVSSASEMKWVRMSVSLRGDQHSAAERSDAHSRIAAADDVVVGRVVFVVARSLALSRPDSRCGPSR